MTPQALIAPARLARRSVLATQSDSRLVDLVRAGYEPAFETIVARYRGALLRYAERFLSRERAEDVVQQSLVSAYEAMLRDTAELNLRPWLYRIAHNTALNGLRDRALGHAELDETIDGVERPDQAVERSQGLREVVAAVQALPERQRDAIVLRELEGRSYEEIATAMGVSDGSVRQLLNRARNTLRAGASALLPIGLLLRIPLAAQSEPIAVRIAELCGAAGAGAALTKVGATAAVTATLVGGAVVLPDRVQTDRDLPPAAAAQRDRSEPAGAGERAEPPPGGDQPALLASGQGGVRARPQQRAKSEEDRSGPSGDRQGEGREDEAARHAREEPDEHEDRSGPGGGGGGGSGSSSGSSSGPGSGGGDSSGSGGGDSSGPGGGGEDAPEAEATP